MENEQLKQENEELKKELLLLQNNKTTYKIILRNWVAIVLICFIAIATISYKINNIYFNEKISILEHKITLLRDITYYKTMYFHHIPKTNEYDPNKNKTQKYDINDYFDGDKIKPEFIKQEQEQQEYKKEYVKILYKI